MQHGGVTDHFVPLADQDLTGDQQGGLVVTILDDFRQVTTLVGGERLGSQSSSLAEPAGLHRARWRGPANSRSARL